MWFKDVVYVHGEISKQDIFIDCLASQTDLPGHVF